MIPRRATLTLTASLGNSGEEAWRIMIPMEKVESSLSPLTDLMTSSTLSSDTGCLSETLTKILTALQSTDVQAIERDALELGYGVSPCIAAAAMMRDRAIQIVKEVMENADQP